MLTKMKKQYVLIGLFYVSLFSLFSQQQTVKLNFSAKMQDNTWQALDSVCITNQSRSWCNDSLSGHPLGDD